MKTTAGYPRVHVDTADVSAIGHAGGVLLTETTRAAGLDRVLSAALSPWRKPGAVHDPAKVVLDLAMMLALGGDALSDIATLHAEPGVYGRVASDPTVSRVITALAGDADRVLAAIATARQEARVTAWARAGAYAPDTVASPDAPLVIDLDATLLTAHSEKEHARPTWKKGFGFHPLCAFVDHGQAGSGEMLAIKLRPGNAGSNTAADHIDVTKAALAQLPGGRSRPGKSVLIRADSAGGTHEYVSWLTGRRLSYSVGFTLPHETPQLYRLIPEDFWEPALDADGDPRDGAAVAEFTGILNLESWPTGMRVIVRRERPPPRRATPVRRCRRIPTHRVRHQHQTRPVAGPRAASPPQGALRGPDPQREGHRAAQPPAARIRPEPDLVRDRRPRGRPDRLGRAPRPPAPRSPPLGTEASAAPPVHDPRDHRPTRPPHDPAPLQPVTLGQHHAHRDRQAPRPARTQRLTPRIR